MRIYDEKRQKVDIRFLDMCTTIGKHAATAEAIFEKMNAILSAHAIAWEYCVKIGVDNTSINIGRHNSILTRVHNIASNAYFISCQCHITHNTANTAADAIGSATSFDVKDLVIDMFYWFDRSTKRKSMLVAYCCFCDVCYRKIVKHVSTRLLSLEAAVERVLKVYDGLRSYFLSESCSQAQF